MILSSFHPRRILRGVPGGMNRCLPVLFLGLAACTSGPGPSSDDACSDAWYRALERKVMTGDGQGHGPDVGSEEWKSAVEFRLGLRGRAEVPARDGGDWCRYIEARVREVGTGPVRFVCEGGGEVVVTFFRTAPPTLVAEHGGEVARMHAAPSASGAKYEGHHRMFWEHQGEARIVWGEGAAEMLCRPSP